MSEVKTKIWYEKRIEELEAVLLDAFNDTDIWDSMLIDRERYISWGRSVWDKLDKQQRSHVKRIEQDQKEFEKAFPA